MPETSGPRAEEDPLDLLIDAVEQIAYTMLKAAELEAKRRRNLAEGYRGKDANQDALRLASEHLESLSGRVFGFVHELDGLIEGVGPANDSRRRPRRSRPRKNGGKGLPPGAVLLARQMAASGAPHEEIETRLRLEFGIGDASSIIALIRSGSS